MQKIENIVNYLIIAIFIGGLVGFLSMVGILLLRSIKGTLDNLSKEQLNQAKKISYLYGLHGEDSDL